MHISSEGVRGNESEVTVKRHCEGKDYLSYFLSYLYSGMHDTNHDFRLKYLVRRLCKLVFPLTSGKWAHLFLSKRLRPCFTDVNGLTLSKYLKGYIINLVARD